MARSPITRQDLATSVQAAPQARTTPSRGRRTDTSRNSPTLHRDRRRSLTGELERFLATAAPLFTRIAGETQMHHLMPTTQTMTSSWRLVGGTSPYTAEDASEPNRCDFEPEAAPPTRDIGSSLLERWRRTRGSASGARAKGRSVSPMTDSLPTLRATAGFRSTPLCGLSRRSPMSRAWLFSVSRASGNRQRFRTR